MHSQKLVATVVISAMLCGALATHAGKPEEVPGGKLIAVRGDMSHVMKGDKVEGYANENALPVLLNAGWRITSVHIAPVLSRTHKAAIGYMVLAEAGSTSAARQKVVGIRGDMSYLMEGDQIKGHTKENALPALLNTGWKIMSVHLASETSKDHDFAEGYVILEK